AETFVVGRTLPEMRVVEDISDTATIDFDDPLIIDNRRTPLDFGAVAQAATSPTKTFIVENHGFAELTISSVQLPAGFSVAEPLNTTIAPTSSDLFSIAMDTSATGPMSGRVTIISNDHAAADLDTDGDVDGGDFLRLQRGIGIVSGASLSDGDANGNDSVGADDLQLWLEQYASSTETVFEFDVEGEVMPSLATLSSIPAFQLGNSTSDKEGTAANLEQAFAEPVSAHALAVDDTFALRFVANRADAPVVSSNQAGADSDESYVADFDAALEAAL
ncbi:MAG: choice-of-anchor D domain-containing protein, partial [Bythopirellula sp.]